MSDLSFDPIYKLTVIQAAQVVDIAGLSPQFFEDLSTITEISEHRIQFKIQKHLKKQPNSGEITIANLNAASRDSFKRGPTRIRLEAGYAGTLRQLFIGDVRFADSKHEGTEWLTKLQIADGGRAYAEAFVNRSFGKGTPYATIVNEIAKVFGVAAPPEIRDTGLRTRLATGDVVMGYAADELTRVLLPFGLTWSFQDGRLQILAFDRAVPGTARVLSQDTGMVGSPEIDPPKIHAQHVGTRGGAAREVQVPKLKVKHLLFPELTPGEPIQVQSQAHATGTFRIDVVTHEGDNFGDEWITMIEASAL